MLSILIVNWNTRELLQTCIQSILDHAPSQPFEIVCVDNASQDGSAEAVRTRFPSVKLIASDRNTGYAAGNNIAFNAARGEFLLTLNPDTEFQDDSLDRALAYLTEHAEAGCLGIRQVGLDGKVQHSVRGFPSLLGILGDATGLGKRFPGTALDSYRLTSFDYQSEGPAPQPMGTFLLFRRQALDSVGDPHAPFDENFPIFFNEVDLLFRLKEKGWDCLYYPGAHVLHHGGESTRQVRKSMIWESHRSLVRYLRKHAGTGFGRLGLPFLAALVYAAAFVRAKGYDAGFRP